CVVWRHVLPSERQPRPARGSSVRAMRATGKRVVVGVSVVELASGVGSGKKSDQASPTTTPGTGAKPANVPGTGTGVTADTIKLGISLIDFQCIPKSFVDSVSVNQPQAYDAYINNINEHGGINGRKIVPV